jgi:uncharacterized protein (TIGR02147 family)
LLAGAFVTEILLYIPCMIYEHKDYRAFLKSELADRAAQNKQYSLRAFSKKLGVSSSYLSEVLQNKKSLSVDKALEIATNLGLSGTESHYFCLLVQADLLRGSEASQSIEAQLQTLNPHRKTQDLSLDMFRTISDWYHFAILELTFLEDFKVTPLSAAKKLLITKAEAEVAIDRLLRLELLEKDQRGNLRRTEDYTLAQSYVSNQALKSFHTQLLNKAIKALVNQSPSERISNSDIVAIAPENIAKVRKLSDQFTEELLKLADRSKNRSSVYCLSVHFFNLTSKGS